MLTSKAATWAAGCGVTRQREIDQSRQEEELENSHPSENGGGILGAELQLLGVPLYNKEVQIPDTSDSWDRITAFCSAFSVQINVLCILNGNLKQIETWHEITILNSDTERNTLSKELSILFETSKLQFRLDIFCQIKHVPNGNAF